MLNLPIIDKIPGGFYTFCGVSLFLLILLVYFIKRYCCTHSNSKKIYTSYYEDDNNKKNEEEEESKDQNNITYSQLKYKYYLERDKELSKLEIYNDYNNNSLAHLDSNHIQSHHSTISFNGINGNSSYYIDNESILLESGVLPHSSLMTNSLSSYKSTFRDSRKLLAFETPSYPLPGAYTITHPLSSRLRLNNNINNNGNNNNNKLMCKMITHKSGVFIRETSKIDSPIVKQCNIANEDGVLLYKTKFFCDYQATLPVFIKNASDANNNDDKIFRKNNYKNKNESDKNQENEHKSNSQSKYVIRLRVVSEEGQHLGWTSATNIKGESLCIDIPDYRNRINNKNDRVSDLDTKDKGNQNHIENIEMSPPDKQHHQQHWKRRRRTTTHAKRLPGSLST